MNEKTKWMLISGAIILAIGITIGILFQRIVDANAVAACVNQSMQLNFSVGP